MSPFTTRRLGVVGTLLALAACSETTAILIGTKLEGESCKQVSDCEAGFDCTDGVCTVLPPLTTGPQRGDPCTSDTQCAPNLICGRQDVCTTGPLLDAGEPCVLTLECKKPLICNGLTGVCGPDDGSAGTYGLGDACLNILDCERPYICGLDNKCDKPPFLSGPNCTRSDAESGAFRIYWEVPPDVPADQLPADYEFDRLPFPNDMRVKSGHVSLDGMSSPGEVLGINITDTYYSAVQEDAPGFALNQPVFFRFSDIVDHTTVCLDADGVYPALSDPTLPAYCATGGSATVYLVNIDPTAGAEYGKHIPVQMNMSRDGGMYICQNWLGIAPKDGEPLKPSTKYAAVITTSVKDLRGEAPIRDQAFDQLMNGTGSIPAMQPLLTWIADKGIDASTIAGATVFTTADPTTVAAKIRTAVSALAAPAYDNVGTNHPVVCNVGITSPCDDRDTHARGCSPYDAGANFHEIQGTYQSPVFQADGTSTTKGRPYARPEDGGAFVYDGQGVPTKQRDETMCFAVAVPKTAMPTNGFPVVILEHGTGGNYRSFIDDGIATELVAQGYAVIGIDNVMHGWRNWPMSPPPATLPLPSSPAPVFVTDEARVGQMFFNIMNPRASRDNILQGSADLFYLTRLVRNTTATLPSPNGAFHFNPSRVYYIGHSQGTVISPPFLTAEPDLKAAVLSGAGADLALSILNKKQPSDISVAAAAVFADQTLSRIHPMMGIIAMLFAPTDSISYARTWVAPHTERGALSLMHISGIGDSYTPYVTQEAMMRASGMPIIVPVGGAPDQAVAGVPVVQTAGATGNLNGATAGVVQYTPDGAYDGHFVMYEHPAAKASLVHFFSSANGSTPAVGQLPEIVR